MITFCSLNTYWIYATYDTCEYMLHANICYMRIYATCEYMLHVNIYYMRIYATCDIYSWSNPNLLVFDKRHTCIYTYNVHWLCTDLLELVNPNETTHYATRKWHSNSVPSLLLRERNALIVRLLIKFPILHCPLSWSELSWSELSWSELGKDCMAFAKLTVVQICRIGLSVLHYDTGSFSLQKLGEAGAFSCKHDNH